LLAEFYEKSNIEGAASQLMECSLQKWKSQGPVVDDITFIVVFLYVYSED